MDPGAHRGSQGTGGVDPGHRSVAKALEEAAPLLVAARLPYCREHPQDPEAADYPVDVEAMGQVAQRNGIQDVPTIALLRNGVAVATSVGVKYWRQIEAAWAWRRVEAGTGALP
jgi:hypothetical protein